MSRKRKSLTVMTAAFAVPPAAAVIGVIKWKEASDQGAQQPVEREIVMATVSG